MRIGMDGANGVSDQERYAKLHEADAVKKAEQVEKPEDSGKADKGGMPVDEYIPPNAIKKRFAIVKLAAIPDTTSAPPLPL